MASAAAGGEVALVYLVVHLGDGGSRVYHLVPACMSPHRFLDGVPIGLPPAVHFAVVRNELVATSVALSRAGQADELGESSGDNTLELLIWPHRACIKIFEGPNKKWVSTSLYFLENVVDCREIEPLGDISVFKNNELIGGLPTRDVEDGHRFLGCFADFQSLDFPPVKLEIGRDIIRDTRVGSGAGGSVFKCNIFHQHEGAIKICWKNKEESEPLEITILSMLHHPNILQFYCAGVDAENQIYICTELCERTLKSYINRSSDNQLASDERLFKDIVSGLEEVHKHGIVHRDLKPGNILLGANNTIRLIDFGHSAFMPADGKFLPGVERGTRLYLAPEMKRILPHNQKVDIFTLGLIYYELFASKERFGKLLPETKRTASLKKIRHKIHFSKNWGNLSDSERSWHHYSFAKGWRGNVALLRKMIMLKSRDRPSADQIMEMLVAETQLTQNCSS